MSETQPHPDLEQQLAYLAEHLLGWTRSDGAWWAGVDEVHLRRLLTGNGMLGIVSAMQRRGWRSHLYANGDYTAAFQRDVDEDAPEDTITFAQRVGLTMPEAVAHAAYAALQETAK